MDERGTITLKELENLESELMLTEKSAATIEKYLHDAGTFIVFLGGRKMCMEEALSWKKELAASGLAPSTINCRIAAANALFKAVGFPDIRIRALRVQKRAFRDDKKDLSFGEYRRLVDAARRRKDEQLSLLFETICATGIRVSEVKHITVKAAKEGVSRISLKGKIRTILIPKKLCRKLIKYAHKNHITEGEIFLGRSGRGLTRGRIWAMMKSICTEAGVNAAKVFPHNLRHLFARQFYKKTQDLVMLSDVLGHTSIQTTRIYLISTGTRHRRYLEELGFVI